MTVMLRWEILLLLLPAGMVEIAPIENTANGVVILTCHNYRWVKILRG